MRPDRVPFDTWLSKALRAGHDAVMRSRCPTSGCDSCWSTLARSMPRTRTAE
jgi:hypothetical protein